METDRNPSQLETYRNPSQTDRNPSFLAEDGNGAISGQLPENEENEKAFARDPSEFISLGVLRIAN